MADVYLAVARGPADYKKLVVLKVLRPDVAAQEQPGFLRMFLDEGRLAGRLNHPHIIHSYEPGVDAGQHFIAMEYLEGQALNVLQNRWWQQHDAHTVALELFVIAQVLDGLEYAHTLTDYDGTPLDIVHRDVSPQNVFVTYSGHSKLLDFGIAKTLESSQTQGGIVKGKVAYMAPEQVRTRALDRRADLFSVGVMLWECIAGRRMHADASVFDILRRVGEGDLPKLRDVAPNVSPRLEAMITRALAFEPSQRYPDAQSFREAILGLPELQGISARDVAVRLDQLFAKERSELNRLIHEAMSGAEELDLPASSASRADPAWTGAHEPPSNHASSNHASSNHASSNHASSNHASSNHASSNHASSNHASSNHASSNHASSNHASSNHASSNHAQTNTLPILAHTVASSSPATTAASTVPAPVAVRNWRKSAWLAAAAGVALLVGIASFVSTRSSSAPPTSSSTNPSAASQNTVSPNAATLNASAARGASPNPASPNPAGLGATGSSAASPSAADMSAAVAAQRTPENVAPNPDGAGHPSAASSQPAKVAVPFAEQKPKTATPSPTKTNPGALRATDSSNSATPAQPKRRAWVVPFPKLERTKPSNDSGARH